MSKQLAAFLIITLANICAPAEAATHEVHSCYDAISLPGVTKPAVKRELFVLVDQTVLFNDALKQEITEKVQKFLSPGDEIVLLSFSAYASGRYPNIALDGVIDTPPTLDQRFYIGKNALAAFDKCLSQQSQGLRYLVTNDLQTTFANSSEKLPNTALVGTLYFLSEQIAKSPEVRSRYLLIASDMLEYSDVNNFYLGGSPRLIDPKIELQKVQKAGLIANFKGIKVYVIGAGFSPKQNYLPANDIAALEAFWRSYFEASNATLDEFGTPSLINGIGSVSTPRAGK